MKTRPLPRSASWIRIFYGYYEMNAGGTIRRVRPGRSTYPGRILTPYLCHRSAEPRVTLTCPDGRWQVTVSHLRNFTRRKITNRCAAHLRKIKRTGKLS